MKVVYAIHHFPPRYTGGAELRALRTAGEMQSRGHQVQVVCVERIDSGPQEGVKWEDDRYAGLRVRRLSFNLASAPDRFLWDYDNPWIGDHLYDLLGKIRPDLFHLIGGYLISGRALQVAQALGIPCVVSLTDFWFLCPRTTLWRSDGRLSSLPVDPLSCARCLGEERRRYRLPARLAPALMDFYWRGQTRRLSQLRRRQVYLHQTLNASQAILSPSQFLRNLFIEAGIDAQRIHFMRQGLEFVGQPAEESSKPPATHLRVGYLGQIAEHKGLHVLFEAARRLPGVPLSVHAYGNPSVFPRYTRRLQRLAAIDHRLQIAGPYQRQQVSQVFHRLDVVVVPSLWYENSPNVILEAFAHRTPVIASRLGGMAELVRHGENGLLFAPGDSDDLARQLRRLAEDPALLARLRVNVPPVKVFNEEMDQLETLYAQIVNPVAQERLLKM